MKKPKILFVDIETAPILARVWDIWEQNIGLNQIKSDWHLLSWAAKWADNSKVMYCDQRGKKDVTDDTELLKQIWKLLDEADIVVSQNGKKFDTKKLNARFIMAGFQPPSSFRQIDTLVLSKKHFAFTSNKLEHLTSILCKKYKKLTKRKFAGFELWKECLAGNRAAWREMSTYNKLDILSLEELYNRLAPWDNSINFSVYSDNDDIVCKCGSDDFTKNGFFYSNTGKYQRFKCSECGAETRSRENLLSKEKRKSLTTGTTR